MKHISDKTREEIDKIIEKSRDDLSISMVLVISTDGVQVSSSIWEKRDPLILEELSALSANYAVMYRAFEASRLSQNKSVSQGYIIIDQEESYTIIVKAGKDTILVSEFEMFAEDVDIEEVKKIAEEIEIWLG